MQRTSNYWNELFMTTLLIIHKAHYTVGVAASSAMLNLDKNKIM